MKEELWIVGQAKSIDGKQWEFQGVFDSHSKALAACRDHSYFIMAGVELNQELPHDTVTVGYYPKPTDP